MADCDAADLRSPKVLLSTSDDALEAASDASSSELPELDASDESSEEPSDDAEADADADPAPDASSSPSVSLPVEAASLLSPSPEFPAPADASSEAPALEISVAASELPSVAAPQKNPHLPNLLWQQMPSRMNTQIRWKKSAKCSSQR